MDIGSPVRVRRVADAQRRGKSLDVTVSEQRRWIWKSRIHIRDVRRVS